MATEQDGFEPINHPQLAPDGGKTRAEYNKAHGRRPNAPLSGGDRQAAYDALLSKGKAVD
jgi:hypothetical protein